MAPPAKTAFSLTVVMQEAVRVTATGSQQSHGTSTTAGLMAALEELSSRPERRADILQNHARVSDERGATMLHLAAVKGDLSAVKLLLSHSPPVLIDSFASGGLTPLHLASQQGHAAETSKVVPLSVDSLRLEGRLSTGQKIWISTSEFSLTSASSGCGVAGEVSRSTLAFQGVLGCGGICGRMGQG